MKLVVLLFCVFTILRRTDGHGRLWEPPGRSTMFRRGFQTAANYNDNQLFCGGFSHQWGKNGGKCGVCGDPFDGPRDNEAGGRYAPKIISREYKQGQDIDVTVEITANHRGWFEFRLCANNDFNKRATKKCFDDHLLKNATDGKTRLAITTKVGFHNFQLQLPEGLTCTQCILQWKYHTGNSWGRDANGKGCVGCGAQEEFYGCSDVAIKGDENTVHKETSTIKTTTERTTTKRVTTQRVPTTATPTTTTRRSSSTTTTTSKPTTSKATQKPSTPKPLTSTQSTTTQRPLTQKVTTTTLKPTSGNGSENKKPATGICRSLGLWKSVSTMDNWCKVNCAAGFCPPTHCTCS